MFGLSCLVLVLSFKWIFCKEYPYIIWIYLPHFPLLVNWIFSFPFFVVSFLFVLFLLPLCLFLLYSRVIFLCYNFCVILSCYIFSRVESSFFIFVLYFSACGKFVLYFCVVFFCVWNFRVIFLVLYFSVCELFVLYFFVVFLCYIFRVVFLSCIFCVTLRVIFFLFVL